MRLIDANKIGLTDFEILMCNGDYKEGLEMILQKIEDAPTIDAVPVVRCRDCKYYMKSNEQCELVDTRLKFYSTHKRWTEESFCSWGERKDGDVDG